VLIRYLVRDNESLFGKAKDFFDQVKAGSVRAVILESVIAECIYILTKIYKVPRNEAAESLIDILRYKGIANHDQRELIRALALFSERNLDIVDCILCVKAATPHLSLFSFDRELNKMSVAKR
jgi:predicted nucleic-acid-binding protein